MSYRERVLDKIQNSDRAEERTLLWERVCSAHEDGGAEEVEARIATKVDNLRNSFDEVAERLQRML